MSIRRVDPTKLRINAPIYEHLRLTIPVREALEEAGNRITPEERKTSHPYAFHTVTLTGTVPHGIVEVLIAQGDEQHHALRLTTEPAYPNEWGKGAGIAWHEHGQWMPCPAPTCGRALVWYEAALPSEGTLPSDSRGCPMIRTNLQTTRHFGFQGDMFALRLTTLHEYSKVPAWVRYAKRSQGCCSHTSAS